MTLETAAATLVTAAATLVTAAATLAAPAAAPLAPSVAPYAPIATPLAAYAAATLVAAAPLAAIATPPVIDSEEKSRSAARAELAQWPTKCARATIARRDRNAARRQLELPRRRLPSAEILAQPPVTSLNADA